MALDASATTKTLNRGRQRHKIMSPGIQHTESNSPILQIKKMHTHLSALFSKSGKAAAYLYSEGRYVPGKKKTCTLAFGVHLERQPGTAEQPRHSF